MCRQLSQSYLALKIKGLNLWLFHNCRDFQHFTAGVADTEMNDISSPCSSLASRILRLSFSPRLFLLWCCKPSEIGTIVPCTSGVSVFLRWIYVPLFFGVEGFVLNFTAVHFSSLALKIQCQKSPPLPALLWCSQSREIGIIAPCTSGGSVFPWWICIPLSLVLRALCWILQRFIFLLWRWKSNARNHRSSLHFAGVSQLTDEFNPVSLFVRTQFAGVKMKVRVSRKAVVKWTDTKVKSSCRLCSSVVVSLLQYE